VWRHLVRRALIRFVLPFVICLLPLLAAGLIILATPSEAMRFYLERVSTSHLDWLILGLGGALFVLQMLLTWWALQWRGAGFDDRPDRWLTSLGQAAEWFPLLGLIGTVTGILQTFDQLASSANPKVQEIVRAYAPAITATGSGLFMALINIVPTWIVGLGRDVILTLGGRSDVPPGDARS
jgi:hypothetical protein